MCHLEKLCRLCRTELPLLYFDLGILYSPLPIHGSNLFSTMMSPRLTTWALLSLRALSVFAQLEVSPSRDSTSLLNLTPDA